MTTARAGTVRSSRRTESRSRSRSRPATRTRSGSGERRAVVLLLPVAVLVVIGLGAVLSASSVISIRLTPNGDHLFFFKRQLIWVAVGGLALLITSRIPYRNYARLAAPILVVAVAGLIATLVVGEARNGAQRWIVAGPVTIQPSEFAKFAVVVFLANAMARKEGVLGRFAHYFWPIAISLGVVGVLVMRQPDLGTAMIIGTAGLAVIAASSAPLRFVAATVAAAVAAVSALAFSASYRRDRITGFLDPLADRFDTGLQAFQSLVALSTGGWFGVGLGASRARWSFLPNAHTDFIFAIIGEETGFAGAIAVVGLFAAFAFAGTVVALRAPDRFGRLLAIGLVAGLSVQALVNIAGVVTLAPITGVPLPFVSAGGSAMLVNMAIVGVLVNIARSRGSRRARR